MKRFIVGLSAMCALGCAGLGSMGIPEDLTGCDAYIDHDTMAVWSPEQVLQGNVDALNDESMDCYMGVFHPDSEQITASLFQTKALFDQYDLNAQFEGPLKVESTSSGDALVSFVQLTKNDNAEPFDPNRSRGVHTMRKNAEGRWRLVQTSITHREAWAPQVP